MRQRNSSKHHGVVPLGDTDGDGRAELWIAPVRRNTSPSHYSAAGLSGGEGERLSIDRTGNWRAAPLRLFGGAVGENVLIEVRATDLGLLGVEHVPTMAINADVPGSVRVRVLRRGADGRYRSVAALPSEAGATVRHPGGGDGLLRCVVDTDGDGTSEVVTDALAGTGLSLDRLQRWELVGGRAPVAHAVMLPSAPDLAGLGRRAIDCSRDVTGDGRVDLVEFLGGLGPLARMRARILSW